MRVLHVLDHSLPLHSGYAFRTKSILLEQRKLGLTTFHVTSNKQGPCSSMMEECEQLLFYRTPMGVLSQPSIPLVGQWNTVHSLNHRLKKLVKELKPDILHAHSPSLTGLAALNVAKKNRLPLIYEVRAFWEDAATDHKTHRENGLRYRSIRHLETYLLKKVDGITTICEGLKHDIIHRGIPKDKITVIPNAVDIEKFKMDACDIEQAKKLKKVLNLNNEFVLGFIGSLYSYEGLRALMASFSKLNQACGPLKLVIVGGGPDYEAMHQHWLHHEQKEHIILVGKVPQSQVKAYYHLIDVCVYPRHAMRLTQLVTPLKPLEAMAMNKCVLASDVQGHRELIHNNVNGFLYQADDTDDLIRALTEIRAHSNLGVIRSQAKDFIQQKRSWSKSVSAYPHVYQKAQEAH